MVETKKDIFPSIALVDSFLPLNKMIITLPAGIKGKSCSAVIARLTDPTHLKQLSNTMTNPVKLPRNQHGLLGNRA